MLYLVSWQAVGRLGFECYDIMQIWQLQIEDRTCEAACGHLPSCCCLLNKKLKNGKELLEWLEGNTNLTYCN